MRTIGELIVIVPVIMNLKGNLQVGSFMCFSSYYVVIVVVTQVRAPLQPLLNLTARPQTT